MHDVSAFQFYENRVGTPMRHLLELFSRGHTAFPAANDQSRTFHPEPVIPIVSLHGILRSDHVFGIEGEGPPSGHGTEGVFQVRLETRPDALRESFASGKNAGPCTDKANICAAFKADVLNDDGGNVLGVTRGELHCVDAAERITEKNSRTADAELAKESLEIAKIVFSRVCDSMARVSMTSLIKSDYAPIGGQVRSQSNESEAFHPVSVEGNQQPATAT